MALIELVTWIVAALLGAIGHEVAHWVVWQYAGRSPWLDLWRLTVIPRAGPAEVTEMDKVAAAAPYAVGLVCCIYGIITWHSTWVIFSLAMIQIPSEADIETIRGNVTWRSLAVSEA